MKRENHSDSVVLNSHQTIAKEGITKDGRKKDMPFISKIDW
jgi:hypothetical protein